MSKIKYTSKDIPSWLPEKIRTSAVERLEHLNNMVKNLQNLSENENILKHRKESIRKISDSINFIYPLLIDERMKNAWRKLFKISESESVRFIHALESSYFIFYSPESSQFIDPTNWSGKTDAMQYVIESGGKFLTLIEDCQTSYISEFSFDKKDYNQLKYLGQGEHENMVDELKKYLDRIKEVLLYHEQNKENYKAISYLLNPVSRKKSLTNAEAILWTKKIKSLSLKLFNKALNKEIGIMISILFPDDKNFYDEDYIAKITKDVSIAHKKMEDLNPQFPT